MWWRISQINPADAGNFMFNTYLVTFGLCAFMFAGAIGLVGYSTTVTKKKFIKEFNVFMQSLPSQKS
jgi:hypothetical protein